MAASVVVQRNNNVETSRPATHEIRATRRTTTRKPHPGDRRFTSAKPTREIATGSEPGCQTAVGDPKRKLETDSSKQAASSQPASLNVSRPSLIHSLLLYSRTYNCFASTLLPWPILSPPRTRATAFEPCSTALLTSAVNIPLVADHSQNPHPRPAFSNPPTLLLLLLLSPMTTAHPHTPPSPHA